jgi:hypothetical protein
MSTPPSPAGGKRPPTGSVEAQFLPLVDQLDLQPLQKEFLRRRWLDQVGWLENRAASSQRWYNRMRLITIVGGIIIPAPIGLNVSGEASQRIRWTVFGLGLVVALAATIEGFFHFGDRWPRYRRTAELLKSGGRQFFQLSGPYAGADSHTGAYPLSPPRLRPLSSATSAPTSPPWSPNKPSSKPTQAAKQPTVAPPVARRLGSVADPSASPLTASAESDRTGIAHSPGGAT